MSSLSLDITIRCYEGNGGGVDSRSTSCSWATELQNAVSCKDTDDAAFLTTASSLVLSMEHASPSERETHPTTLAVFIPPSLTDASAFARKQAETQCRNTVWVNSPGVSWLQRIHSLLCEHGRILGIVSLCRSVVENRRSDIVLVDVSAAPTTWTSRILSTLNGESIASQPDMVLKLIPISNINFHTDKEASTASRQGRFCIPACPVCLHRVDQQRLGLPKPQERQLCSRTCMREIGHAPGLCRNHRFLSPWPPPSNCAACKVIHSRWYDPNVNTMSSGDGVASRFAHNESGDKFCNRCAMQETLWVCLTCGFVGCGRYSHRHAAEHFQESGHPYSLELATFRIWDYTNSEFAHRSDFLECPAMQRLHVHPNAAGRKPVEGALVHPGGHDASTQMAPRVNPYPVTLDGASPKKANMIGEEYEALLQSALEDQAQHCDGELTRLRAALTAENVDRNQMSEEESHEVENLKVDIGRYRGEIDRLGRQLLDAQGQEAMYRTASQRLLREQNVAIDLLDKIREEASRENAEGVRQIEELEQQIDDLTANLRMRQQFSQDQELSNAQIFGTGSSSGTKSSKKGKKTRRFFRR